jgi:phosphoribosyl-AMP cyclohydrolase
MTDRSTVDSLLARLVFNEAGLIPAIAQDHETKAVLMLAWMNEESLRETLSTGHVCYYSRSRQCLWRKGEMSGNRQVLKELRFDCDGDSLLVMVDQKGPACHTKRPSCFYTAVRGDEFVILSEPQE